MANRPGTVGELLAAALSIILQVAAAGTGILVLLPAALRAVAGGGPAGS